MLSPSDFNLWRLDNFEKSMTAQEEKLRELEELVKTALTENHYDTETFTQRRLDLMRNLMTCKLEHEPVTMSKQPVPPSSRAADCAVHSSKTHTSCRSWSGTCARFAHCFHSCSCLIFNLRVGGVFHQGEACHCHRWLLPRCAQSSGQMAEIPGSSDTQ